MADDKEIVRGYAKTKEQEAALIAHGLLAKAVYLEERGAETLEACLATFRDRPGILAYIYFANKTLSMEKGQRQHVRATFAWCLP